MRIESKTWIAWALALGATALTSSARAEGAAVTLTNAPVDSGACTAAERVVLSLADAPSSAARVDANVALGECYASAGRTASAYAAFEEAAKLASQKSGGGDKKRAAAITEEQTKLEPHLSKLIIVLDAPAHAAGLSITRDGAPVDPTQVGRWVPVDPGTHTVRVTAPSRSAWEMTVRVRPEGGMETITVPVLDRDAAEANAPPREGTGQRVAGLAIGGAGLLALGTGILFGLASRSKADEASSHCNPAPDSRCDAAGMELRSSQRADATAATVAFISGFVLVSGGVALYLTAPSGNAPRIGVAPAIGPQAQGFVLRGAF